MKHNRPCPSTRYQGSKRKLTDWLSQQLGELEFDTAVDLLAGTGSVSYVMKSMGKRVIANDYLRLNHATLLAFIENPSIQLEDSEVDWLLDRHDGISYSTFVADTFRDFYFTEEENRWLDQIACNINALSADDPSALKYKIALAQHSLVQACLMKRPFNLFHRKNLYIRTASVERRFGNKTTWDTPFPVLFKRLVRESNGYVFSNGHGNRALNMDATKVQIQGAPLVYIDPPYFGKRRDRAHCNYRLLYHFVEGLVQYDQWGGMIDSSKSLKPLKPNGFSTEELYTCERQDLKDQFLNWLENILHAWPHSPLAISYKHPGVPNEEALKWAIERSGRNVTIQRRHYWYALNRQNGMGNQNVELLFLGT